jgi:hypothetical protein
MSDLGHGEKNLQRVYLVSIASISGIPKCSRGVRVAPQADITSPSVYTANQLDDQVRPLPRLVPITLNQAKPRTILIAWVVGNISPAHCAQTGMPFNGNMKPDGYMDGRSVNWANWIACIWFYEIVEKVIPSARFPAINRSMATRRSGRQLKA